MNYEGAERRKYARIKGRFIVSYRIFDEVNNVDESQTKNLSAGGMLLTTNRKFEVGTKLAIEIRLPFERSPILLIGRVEDSREITQGLIYDTRIQFLAIDENHKRIINKTVGYYLKK